MPDKRMSVPSDLRRRIEETAADMGMPPEWVLRACVNVALRTDNEDAMNDLVIEVEGVARNAVRMPRYHRRKVTA